MKNASNLEKFIGTWRLISSVKILENGESTPVFGSNPLGYIIFTPASVMSVQIMRAERPHFDNEHLLADYLAYTGRYALDDRQQIITFSVETSLSAEYLGKEIQRAYQFAGNRLELKVLESAIDYRVTWERV